MPSPILWLLAALWVLVLAGLTLQVWRQASLVGSYDPALDQLLFAGQRRLAGSLVYRDFVNGTPVVAQYLYAPSAWLGTLRAHRLLVLALNLVGGGLLWSCLRQLGSLGLLALRRDSLVPPLAAVLDVLFLQLFPGGLSGLLPSLVNTLLVLVLFLVLRGLGFRAGLAGGPASAAAPNPSVLGGEPASQAPAPGAGLTGRGGWRLFATGSGLAANLSLALAGAVLLLIVNAVPPLLSPLLLLAVLLGLLLKPRRPWSLVLPILAGGLGGLVLLLLPYQLRPGGLVQVWAGAVQLPLELANRGAPPSDPLLERLVELLTLSPAGLPLWLLGLVPVLELLRRWRTGGRSLLLLPALAAIFSVDLLLSLQRAGSGRSDLPLLVLPAVLVIGAGLASLESRPGRRSRRVALVTVLLISLIAANNVFLAAVLHPPRGPRPPLLELEHDRAAVRRYVAAQQPALASLQAPQDTALLRELALASGVVGVGPDWSLDQQNLHPSWATRSLGLPIGTAEACRQLTAAPHDLIVWMHTDSREPNREASLRACLGASGSGWQPIADQLGLGSGQILVFRRAAPDAPPPQGSQVP